jgi:hypothetical protein
MFSARETKPDELVTGEGMAKARGRAKMAREKRISESKGVYSNGFLVEKGGSRNVLVYIL